MALTPGAQPTLGFALHTSCQPAELELPGRSRLASRGLTVDGRPLTPPRGLPWRDGLVGGAYRGPLRSRDATEARLQWLSVW